MAPVIQMRSIGWGLGQDGEMAELMQLARVDGTLEQVGTGAQERFEAKRKQEATSREIIARCNARLKRFKEEITMLRIRLRRVRLEAIDADPILGAVPKQISLNGGLYPVGVATARIHFIEEDLGPKPPGHCMYDLDAEDPTLSDDEEDEPELQPVTMWIDRKIKSMMLYGSEPDSDEEESDSDDDETNAFLDNLIMAYKRAAEKKPGYTREDYEKRLHLKDLERQRVALTKLILSREAKFRAVKRRLDNAQAVQGSNRMDSHYLCRMNQLQSMYKANNDGKLPDFRGIKGPEEIDMRGTASRLSLAEGEETSDS